MISSLFEAGMLICFGASWPCSLYKVLKTKRVEGKSAAFLWLVFLGYCSGITYKLTGKTDWVLALFFINATIVAVDIAAYYYYSIRNARKEPA